MLLYVQGEGAATLVLHFQETLCALTLSLTNLQKEKKKKKVAHILQNHILVETEGKRGRCRDPQMHVDQEVEGSLHLSRIILMNLEAHG